MFYTRSLAYRLKKLKVPKVLIAGLLWHRSFEYDGYHDDKFGRILAYVWIDCNQEIKIACHGDKALVNEVMVTKGLSVGLIYVDRKNTNTKTC